MMVVDVASDRVLLGRQQRFPPGMWSCLAGFLEVRAVTVLRYSLHRSFEAPPNRLVLHGTALPCGTLHCHPWHYMMVIP